MREATLNELLGEAIVGIDTLWGGDVMNPSGTGRFIADCWFSDQALPLAYTHPAAAALRASGGVSAAEPDRAAVDEYLRAVDPGRTLGALRAEVSGVRGPRGRYLDGLSSCLDVMWALVQERLGQGPPVPYERCVRSVTGHGPGRSDPSGMRHHVASLLAEGGHDAGDGRTLLKAVDAWRADHRVPAKSIPALAGAFIAELDALVVRHVVPWLPAPLREVPRANIRFLPIADAWFSGSMNYLGHARTPEGRPEFEATYEINAALQISVPEFQQLVSHEVVPGHVTTFAYLQDLFSRGEVGFEASVLTMNTRAATLFEGIANNAILMACGVTDVDGLADRDLRIGVLLALLQDAAKNQASYLTWHDGWPAAEVAAELRRDYLVSEERADKLSGAWARHPLLGRMYLPAYQAGTALVARLRREYPPDRLIPVLYGCAGVVDVTTIEEVLADDPLR
jgi:hypothetical protein